MDDYLRYEEPDCRSRKLMRGLAATASRIASMTGCSGDARYEQLPDKLSQLFGEKGEECQLKLMSRCCRADLVQKSYPGALLESLTKAFVLNGLPAEIGKRHARLLPQSITELERVHSADPDLGINAPPPASDQPCPTQQWRPRTNKFQGPRFRGSGGQWTGKPRGGEGFTRPPVALQLALAHKSQKDYYDKWAHGTPAEEGDLVWMATPNVVSEGRKLRRSWEGLYMVDTVLSETTCGICGLDASPGQGFTIHFNKLKPYVQSMEETDKEP
ncbi:unnamed protein product [Mesocestoides corti]|uniref:Calpain catalytic domain-containing protein n=1 Tax=Mesocestoides corti TaxID=53468 RepID=A0A0R3URB2_MESCO|nr:unnamed protein product [Mesocestoides corti]